MNRAGRAAARAAPRASRRAAISAGAGTRYDAGAVVHPAGTPQGVGERIRRVRGWLADFRTTVAELELADLLRADGRRPGDGSDQLALLDSAAQPKLF